MIDSVSVEKVWSLVLLGMSVACVCERRRKRPEVGGAED